LTLIIIIRRCIVITIITTLLILVIFYIAFGLIFSKKKNGNYQQIIQPKINMELIPFEAQGFNVRSRVRKDQWEKICTIVHKKATPGGAYRCQQCGESGKIQGFTHPVECHEVWEFDEINRVQKLVGMVSICPMCHKAKHLGLAEKMGFGAKVREHMAKYNQWSQSQVDEYIRLSKQVVRLKSGQTYNLDLTYLNSKEFYFLQTQFGKEEQYNCDSSMRY
jgi:hypothetical protein